MDAKLILVNIDDGKNNLTHEYLVKLSNQVAGDLSVTLELRSGSPTKQIIKIAEGYQADYIYMGKHDYSVYERLC